MALTSTFSDERPLTGVPNYSGVISSPAVDKPVDDAPSTVTSVNGSRGSSHGNTQVNSTNTVTENARMQISTRTAVGPGRWFQSHAYT